LFPNRDIKPYSLANISIKSGMDARKQNYFPKTLFNDKINPIQDKKKENSSMSSP
jgi:hypothetical protein